jgi:AraC-like DNA-binding protein
MKPLKDIKSIEFHSGSKEELLPGFMPDFPYIASRVELDKFMGRFVPWHWHKTVELFYMESGVLEYYTPKGKMVFPAGSGGMVNSNVLHMTRPQAETEKNIQLLHIFDPSLIAGEQGSRIEQKYVTPIVTAPQVEIIALYPDDPAQARVLDCICKSFQLSEHDFGYEIKLRETLSELWLQLLAMSRPALEDKKDYGKTNDKIKLMMIYIHEHYAEKISIAELAAAAFSSERECFREFHNCLHMTPVEYIKSYRLQMACYMLAKSLETITFISHACGLGSSSYFGKVFREYFGCTPIEYRHRWQDNDI